MIPQSLSQHIDVLLDHLIEDGGVASASLASILVAAREAVESGYDVALCRSVWAAASHLEATRHSAASVAGCVGRSCET